MQRLLFLHGALGAKDQLAELEKNLAGSFLVHSLNFSGHGGSALNEEGFSIARFAKQNIAANEIKMLNAEMIAEKLPAFAAALEKRHAPNNWKTILESTAAMLVKMGKDNPLKIDDYKNIRQQILMMLGDRDKMVTLDETLEVYRVLPAAQLAVLPNTAHPIEVVDKARLAYEITTFLMLR